MTSEFNYLAYNVALGLLLLLAASHAISFQYGYAWTASNRDEPMPPLKGIPGRVDRALINFSETFPFFAALVLLAHVAGRDGMLTLWGARLYFWARVIHAAASVAGYPLLRSMIWNVALAGMVLFIVALL
ncbi:MAG: MAPEG family protein [Terriglobales bacterium]